MCRCVSGREREREIEIEIERESDSVNYGRCGVWVGWIFSRDCAHSLKNCKKSVSSFMGSKTEQLSSTGVPAACWGERAVAQVEQKGFIDSPLSVL